MACFGSGKVNAACWSPRRWEVWCVQVNRDHVWRADFLFCLASIAYRACVHRVVPEFRRRSDGSEIGSVVLCPFGELWQWQLQKSGSGEEFQPNEGCGYSALTPIAGVQSSER